MEYPITSAIKINSRKEYQQKGIINYESTPKRIFLPQRHKDAKVHEFSIINFMA